jgi:hypothetical protein
MWPKKGDEGLLFTVAAAAAGDPCGLAVEVVL